MPSKEVHVTEERFLRFTDIAILGLLVLVSFLLFSLDRQSRRSTDGTESVATARSVSEPESVIPEISKKPSGTVQPQISKSTSANTNYIRDRQ